MTAITRSVMTARKQRAGDRQPPDRLPGDRQPPRQLRGGQEVRGLLRFRWRGPPWRRDERRGQGPGHCLQKLSRDWRVRAVVGVDRVRLHGGFLLQGPCPLGDLGGWSRGPCRARVARENVLVTLAPWYAGSLGSIGQEGASDVAPGVSQYPRIAADLRARILGGQWEPGAGLPGIPDLARQYGDNRGLADRDESAAWPWADQPGA
jgi:hypothetical protein